jgi:hypothetical protein
VAALLRKGGLMQVEAHLDLEGKRRFACAQAPGQP